jgi:HAD superfamily hydrolase (TIGR01509 family)
MLLKPVTEDLSAYLACTEIIDYNDPAVKALAEKLRGIYHQDVPLIKGTFEYVRDEIAHSIDIGGKVVTCKASEVLKAREGFCYAKSHLLAALLRHNGIPAGFCYQQLLLDDDDAPYLILHGLNAVYIQSMARWIRLDARGNKPNVNATFSLEVEQLAFPVRVERGEIDMPLLFDAPDLNVIEKLSQHTRVEALLNDLPKALGSFQTQHSDKINTIIFDAGGVLFYIREFRSAVIRRVLRSMGYDRELVEEALCIGSTFDQNYFTSHDGIYSWEDERNWLEARAQAIARAVDASDATLPEKIRYLAIDTFQYQLYDETVEVLERLKCQYALAVLSNATATLDWAFDYLDLRKYFKEVVISAYEKCEKPDAEIYSRTLNKLGKSPSECVFIDDRIENIEAAAALGFSTYHLQRKQGMTLYDFEKHLAHFK